MIFDESNSVNNENDLSESDCDLPNNYENILEAEQKIDQDEDLVELEEELKKKKLESGMGMGKNGQLLRINVGGIAYKGLAKTNSDKWSVLKWTKQTNNEDQCDICIGFNTNNVTQEKYDLHQKKKKEARQQKEQDKLNAKFEYISWTYNQFSFALYLKYRPFIINKN